MTAEVAEVLRIVGANALYRIGKSHPCDSSSLVLQIAGAVEQHQLPRDSAEITHYYREWFGVWDTPDEDVHCEIASVLRSVGRLFREQPYEALRWWHALTLMFALHPIPVQCVATARSIARVFGCDREFDDLVTAWTGPCSIGRSTDDRSSRVISGRGGQ